MGTDRPVGHFRCTCSSLANGAAISFIEYVHLGHLHAEGAKRPAATTPAKAEQSWLQENATLIVGVVGIVVSGFIGPTVTGWLTSRREQAKDKRAPALRSG